MSLRDDLETSLAITPAKASLTIAHIRTAVELDETLRRARRALTGHNMPRLKALLERAACLFFSLPEADMSQATIPEADTKSLIAELRRRAEQEDDKDALKILALSKKKGARHDHAAR